MTKAEFEKARDVESYKEPGDHCYSFDKGADWANEVMQKEIDSLHEDVANVGTIGALYGSENAKDEILHTDVFAPCTNTATTLGSLNFDLFGCCRRSRIDRYII